MCCNFRFAISFYHMPLWYCHFTCDLLVVSLLILPLYFSKRGQARGRKEIGVGWWWHFVANMKMTRFDIKGPHLTLNDSDKMCLSYHYWCHRPIGCNLLYSNVFECLDFAGKEESPYLSYHTIFLGWMSPCVWDIGKLNTYLLQIAMLLNPEIWLEKQCAFARAFGEYAVW